MWPILRLRPGLNHNFTVLQHAHLCQRLFQLKVDEVGRVERTSKSLFGLPVGVVPHDEPQHIRDTTEEELAYIATRAEEAALAEEAGSLGTMEDEADVAAEEREFAEWTGSTGEPSGVGAGVPLVEEVVEESAEEETEADVTPRPRGGSASCGGLAPASRDTETLAQRAVKRAKASTGGEPPASTPRTPALVVISPDNSPRRSPRFIPQCEFIIHSPSTGGGVRILGADLAGFAGGERQQEEPLRAALDMPPPSTMPPRGASPARAPTAEPTRTEEEEASLDVGGSVSATNIGTEGNTSNQFGTDPPSTDQEDINTVIEEVAKDAEAEATKIAAGEAAKSATKEAAKEPAGETGEAAAGEASKKLQALHHALQDKVNSRMAAVDKAESDFQERVAQTQVWFGEAREELRTAQGELDERKRELILKQALAATLRGKDEEIGKIIAHRTQELEQKHKDALDALARDQASKVEKLELEREGLKKEVSELTEERGTPNYTLADLQVAISDNTKLLSEANGSIDDLKLKLDTLEGTLSEVMAREETLNKALEDERQLRKDDAAA
nr:leucine zipper putative tumor suppressor 2-like [Aegilops tauschii subsp. strangulata]